MRKRSLACVALLAALLASPGWGAEAGKDSGREAFGRLGCNGCHAVTRPQPGMTLAQRLARKGPDLWFAGSKYRADWLRTWLAAPTPVSGIRHDRLSPDTRVEPHPAVPKGDVGVIAAYLMSLTDPDMATGVVPEGRPGRREMLQGRILFGRDQQCFACHRIATRFGAEAGGVSGPALGNAAQRLNADWVYAYLTNPARYVPVGRMPAYSAGPKAYSPEQMLQLTRYLMRMGAEEEK